MSDIIIDKFGNLWYSIKDSYDTNKNKIIDGNAVGYGSFSFISYVEDANMLESYAILRYRVDD